MKSITNIKTRVATDADLPAIQELYAIWGRAFAYLANDQTFIAEVDGRIIGAIRLAFEEEHFVVRSLFVLKKFREKGVGKALLEIVEAELGQTEAYCILLPAQKNLFTHIGFKPIADSKAPNFLSSRKANLEQENPDVLLMKRSMDVEVRSIPARDLPLVMGIIDEFKLPEAKRLSQNDVRGIYSRIVAAGGAVIGAYRGSEIVGTCTLNLCANLSQSGRPYGIIENIIVTKNERGKGIGTSLLLFARRMAESKRCYKVSLMSEQVDPETASFLKSAGFTNDEIGFRRRPGVAV